MQEQMLRVRDLSALTGLTRQTIYRLKDERKIPAPIDIGGGRSLRWLKSEVDAWLQSRMAARAEVR